MEKNEMLVDSEELQQMKCPRCGGLMDHGYIAGHWFKLRWVQTNHTKTVFAGSSLRKKLDSAWSSPTIEAVRCDKCKIGIFRFDY
ncbi:MAG TPA: PF20097 family protein [Thermotogota bacterium]|nr:PF20097 family protein [Thermotogota bacterium]HRW93789.1 PF20097 family protein [Thermotogota bacterium]